MTVRVRYREFIWIEDLVELIEQCLAQDPRPAYQQPQPERRYGACFWDLDVHWHYPEPGRIRVLDMQMAQSTA